MIHEIVVAVKTHTQVPATAEAIHAYPAFAEGLKMAASDRLEKRA